MHSHQVVAQARLPRLRLADRRLPAAQVSAEGERRGESQGGGSLPADGQTVPSTVTTLNLHDVFTFVMQVRDKIKAYNAKGKPVAVAIVEPIQAEGGDRYATPYFFTQLQKIIKKVC